MNRSSPASILIADDDPQFVRLLEHHLKAWSYRVEAAGDKGQLLRRLAAGRPDLVLLDVRFGEHDGVEVLRQVLAEHPGLRVAMLTAHGSIDNAIAAIRIGALDYLTKPVDLPRLRSVVAQTLDGPPPAPPRVEAPARATAGAPAPAEPVAPSRPILGESPAARELRELIGRVAVTDATALILGESGTGKELVARAIHELSPRRHGPFVPLNVAALPRELVESTLFGHEKGAFTGADQMQRGCCEAADQGTLFLDEIGEMEVNLQAKLLRFLQERSFQRVGQSKLIRVDVRIVAATNRDPLEQVRKGQLREDLYYRLNVVPIRVPSLRTRRPDIPLLARHFLALSARRLGTTAAEFSDEALGAMSAYDWPGNIRQLENTVERLAILARGPRIERADVVPELVGGVAAEPATPEAPAVVAGAADGADGLTMMERLEKQAIIDALGRSRGSVREAARILGLGQATVYRKIKRYEISTDS